MRLKLSICLVAAMLVVLAITGAAAEEDDALKKMNDRYEDFVRNSELAYRTFLEESDREYEEFMRDVEQRWGKFVPSTRPVWSSYSSDLIAHGEVNFERGSVVVEVIAEHDAPPPSDELTERLSDQAQAMMSEKNPAGRNVLENQVDRGDGKPVAPSRIDDLVEQKVSAGQVKRRQIETPTGETKTVFSLTLPMVPDHLARASEPYLELVQRQARRFGLPTDLVLAVVHTESWFNPFARSPVPAFGLMQLVPRAGALDAYEFLYGRKRVVDSKYLYQPKNNVELGCAYLHLLLTRYFGSLEPIESRTLAAIAGYNCGPGNTRRALRTMDSRRRVPTQAPPDRVRAALLANVPQETRSYLQLVTDRRRLWRESRG